MKEALAKLSIICSQIVAPKSKKPKLEPIAKEVKKDNSKKSKAERAMEKATESFLKYQQAAEERFMKWEEEQWKRESEMEERRRKQEQQHEMRMLEMLGRFMQPQYPYRGSDPSFDPYNTYDSHEM